MRCEMEPPASRRGGLKMAFLFALERHVRFSGDYFNHDGLGGLAAQQSMTPV